MVENCLFSATPYLILTPQIEPLLVFGTFQAWISYTGSEFDLIQGRVQALPLPF